MASLSNFAANKALDHLFQGGVNYWLALHEEDPGPSGMGAEVSGGGYSRASVQFTTTASSRTKAVIADAYFEDMPGTTVTHVAIWDSQTAGHILASTALDTSMAVLEGYRLNFACGDAFNRNIVITISS